MEFVKQREARLENARKERDDQARVDIDANNPMATTGIDSFLLMVHFFAKFPPIVSRLYWWHPHFTLSHVVAETQGNIHL